jgi:diaminopimelate decarboxylase
MELEASNHVTSSFETSEGCLVIGGMALPRLAERIGHTPFFAYSRDLITGRVAELRAALPPEIHLSYAIKANPMPAVVQHLAGLVDGFDVASALEMKVALDTTMPAERVSFAGPGKRPEEISQAIAAGVLISLESSTEMALAAAIGERLGIAPRVAVRINPEFELKASGMRMGGGAQPFGTDAEKIPELLRDLAELKLGFEGFQIFAGSQNLNAEAVSETQEKSIELASHLSQYAPGKVHTLNIGGGFGIPYFPKDHALDLTSVGNNLNRLMSHLKSSFPDARVIIELGRYIVGEAGIYVCRVIDRKVSRGKTFLVTDGGLHHHLAASGNFGQVVRRNYPVAIGNRMNAGPNETVDVVGCLCTPIDVLARQVALPNAEIGDLIVIFQSGAYGATGSPSKFLSHPEAVEVLV